jgi:hypothetical protein
LECGGKRSATPLLEWLLIAKDIRFFHVASGFESGVIATALQDDKRFWEDFSVAQASRLHVCHNKPACEYLFPQTASLKQALASPEYC